jgi:hypothetical protein
LWSIRRGRWGGAAATRSYKRLALLANGWSDYFGRIHGRPWVWRLRRFTDLHRNGFRNSLPSRGKSGSDSRARKGLKSSDRCPGCGSSGETSARRNSLLVSAVGEKTRTAWCPSGALATSAGTSTEFSAITASTCSAAESSVGHRRRGLRTCDRVTRLQRSFPSVR